MMNKKMIMLTGGGILLFLAGLGFSQLVMCPKLPETPKDNFCLDCDCKDGEKICTCNNCVNLKEMRVERWLRRHSEFQHWGNQERGMHGKTHPGFHDRMAEPGRPGPRPDKACGKDRREAPRGDMRPGDKHHTQQPDKGLLNVKPQPVPPHKKH